MYDFWSVLHHQPRPDLSNKDCIPKDMREPCVVKATEPMLHAGNSMNILDVLECTLYCIVDKRISFVQKETLHISRKANHKTNSSTLDKISKYNTNYDRSHCAKMLLLDIG